MTRWPALIALLAAPLAHAADWQVYESGDALELAIDRDAVWRENGLVHFVNQERFAEKRYDKRYDVRYAIRRSVGWADCEKSRYALVSSSYHSASGRSLYATLFPLQRYNRSWQPVYEGSVADAMLTRVCELGRNAPNKKSPKP
ncbi:surface-adhesin E family protein [Crenobacter cavernae]|uniref:Surface-adhesin protein E-like domain-containing protein n=1 Tax=Crenobacter cavernae TaxID=2290923 RepID=A0A345Y6M1_9NEIS|nr:surface-adhesin E family protein [Crenobacter cavernae]AXK39573.1 hypothetical protein DWG20_09035 [Crenobacter cavernae]